MKKVNRLCLFVLLGFLFFPKFVLAVNVSDSLKLECDEGQTTYDEKEEGIKCTLSLDLPSDETQTFKSIAFNLSDKTVGVDAIVKAADEDIIVTGSLDKGFTLTKKNNATFADGDELLEIEEVTIPDTSIAKYCSDNKYYYNMYPTNGKLTGSDDKVYSIGDPTDVCKATGKFRILSTDNTLANLAIDGTGVAGFNSKAENYKYTSSATSLKITAAANNKNASVKINDVAMAKENKITLEYGQQTIAVKVTSESGAVKTYNIQVFRPYFLFPGYTLQFDSAKTNYTLNVASSTKEFAVCAYDGQSEVFVKKDGTVCFNANVVSEVTDSADYESLLYSLKLNGVYVATEMGYKSERELFDAMEWVTDSDGHQVQYTKLADLKNGENVLVFKISTELPEYKVTINVTDSVKPDIDTTGESTGGNINKEGNQTTDGGTNYGSGDIADSTVDSPKTGIITYTAIIVAVLGLAGGAYYYLRKKNIIKKI